MLVDILTYGGTAVAFFVVGAAVGAHNVPTVAKAIASLKAAESNAINTLTMIGQHKAGTSTPVTVSVITATPAA